MSNLSATPKPRFQFSYPNEMSHHWFLLLIIIVANLNIPILSSLIPRSFVFNQIIRAVFYASFVLVAYKRSSLFKMLWLILYSVVVIYFAWRSIIYPLINPPEPSPFPSVLDLSAIPLEHKILFFIADNLGFIFVTLIIKKLTQNKVNQTLSMILSVFCIRLFPYMVSVVVFLVLKLPINQLSFAPEYELLNFASMLIFVFVYDLITRKLLNEKHI